MKVFFPIFVALLPLFAVAAPPSPSGGTLVNLQAQSTREVPNDWMHAAMSSERQDRDAARAADLVNKTLGDARNLAAKYPSVSVESGGYHSYPVHERDGRSIVGWRARAELRLKGRDFGQLTTLIGALQSQMQFNGLAFTVPPETRRIAENELIAEAVGAFRQRAAIAQAALQAGGYSIKELNLNIQDEGSPPRQMVKMASQVRQDMEVSAPVAQPGASRVTVQAAGSILLH